MIFISLRKYGGPNKSFGDDLTSKRRYESDIVRGTLGRKNRLVEWIPFLHNEFVFFYYLLNRSALPLVYSLCYSYREFGVDHKVFWNKYSDRTAVIVFIND